jgi:hypothetical protein
LFFPDNLNVIQHLFPRQSKSDEDYNDRFAFDLNPESQTVKTPQQTGQKTNGEEAEIEASDLAKVPSSEETDPSSYQLYKTPVPADPDNKSDLYFIGKFVTSWLCYNRSLPQAESFRKETPVNSDSECNTCEK